MLIAAPSLLIGMLGIPIMGDVRLHLFYLLGALILAFGLYGLLLILFFLLLFVLFYFFAISQLLFGLFDLLGVTWTHWRYALTNKEPHVPYD